MSPSEGKINNPGFDLDEGLRLLKEIIGDNPELASLKELLEIGERLQSTGKFLQADAVDIADIVMRGRNTEQALAFMGRVGMRGPRTMLHRAVIGEINRRGQSD